MQERQITVKNLTTNYKICGNGKPMIVLHGWGSNSEKWESVGALLAENNLTVIVPDLPGFGKSQEPKEPWNLDKYSEWLFEFCRNVPELQKSFYLLGHSFGGAIAVKFSIKYNQRVEKLFLAAIACIRKRTLIKKVYYKISKIIKIFSWIPKYEIFRKAFYKFVIKKSDYLSVSGIMKDTYLKIVSEDLSFRLPFVKTATCIIWGDKDELTPLEHANIVNSKISGSKLIIIPEADHFFDKTNNPVILAKKIIENI